MPIGNSTPAMALVPYPAPAWNLAVGVPWKNTKSGAMEVFSLEPTRRIDVNVTKQMMVERLRNGETIKNYKEGGNSMVPLIYSHEPVDIFPITRPIAVNDIVFCRIGRRFFTHLVTAVDGNRVQISNNHGHVNGWTHKSHVYGFVSLSDPR